MMELGETELVPTEDAVEAFMDHLVGPHLPLKFPNNQPPSISLQHTIGNQMHVVFLLYNYYHRRRNPHLEFLDFEPFCKVAVNAKPSLLPLLKYMRSCKGDKLDNNLSIAEKAITDACNIFVGLHTLEGTPSTTQGWPVSKVAVFLTDSMKQNCLLCSSATTPAVWSLIEKSLLKCHNESEAMLNTDMETTSSLRVLDDDEACWRQLAMSAVQEKTGIDPIELSILESHVTPSLTEEKTTACFFIMKSNSVNKDVVQVPIKDVIDSLQGPLVKKSFKRCVVTNVVEYFHLLPYVGMITSWFSRENLANASVLLPHENFYRGSSPMNDQPLTTVATEKGDDSFGTTHIADFLDLKTMNTEHLDQKENGDCYVSTGHNLDDCRSYKFSHPDEERQSSSKILVDDAMIQFSSECNIGSTKSDLTDKEEMVNPVRDACNNQSINVKVADGNDICSSGFLGQDSAPKSSVFLGQDSAPKRDDHLVPFMSDSKDLDKIQAILATEGNEILKDALRGLLTKQKGLYHQQCQLEDEMARCEKDIHTILNDELILKAGTVTDGCNTASSRDANGSHEEPHYCVEGQHPLQCSKRKRLTEPIMYLQNPCQELDNICSENHWTLPRYSIFCTTDGFRSNVTVQGIDFEFSVGGDLRLNAREARESAASHVLSKIHSM